MAALTEITINIKITEAAECLRHLADLCEKVNGDKVPVIQDRPKIGFCGHLKSAGLPTLE